MSFARGKLIHESIQHLVHRKTKGILGDIHFLLFFCVWNIWGENELFREEFQEIKAAESEAARMYHCGVQCIYVSPFQKYEMAWKRVHYKAKNEHCIVKVLKFDGIE